MQNINQVVVTGNLTRDPELRSTGSGTSVCSMRVAVNGRRKDTSGEWVDNPGYYSVAVFGRQGENAAQYLSKGRPVAVSGRLSWREYTDKDGNRREAVEIIADNVQFLGDGQDRRPVESDIPADDEYTIPPVGAGSAAQDDSIPFLFDDRTSAWDRPTTTHNPFE